VAQYLGDGILVYLGFPLAQADADARVASSTSMPRYLTVLSILVRAIARRFPVRR
jgi:hypothetical protein